MSIREDMPVLEAPMSIREDMPVLESVFFLGTKDMNGCRRDGSKLTTLMFLGQKQRKKNTLVRP